MSAAAPLLEAVSISKRFGATQALDSVDFVLRRGEVHALLGENGAGKSTLVKILAGTETADSGELRIDGAAVAEHDPARAAARGLFVVHQELSLVDVLSVAENVFLNRFPHLGGRLGARLGLIDRRTLRARAREGLRIMDYDVDVDLRVGALDQAGKQVIEICRALAGAARIILLDEPTSSLAPDDRARLYRRIAALAARGVAVVIITHNIEEALAVADRITVLRDGRRVVTLDKAEARVETIIEHMSGVATGQVFPARTEAGDRAPRLVIGHLAAAPRLVDVSLEIGAGEIVGLAGLVGAGRTEVMKSLFGLLAPDGGDITLDGRPVRFTDPAAAMRAGLFMISEDRQGEGIIQTAPILQNMAISNIIVRGREDGTAPLGILRWPRIRRICAEIAAAIRIKAASLDASILSLSGGNQQKVILGRCLMNRPRLILADEPTRGVSIGSKIEIYKALRDLAASGVSILVASSEFDELVGLCNRIYLIDRGRTVGEIANTGLTSHELLNLVLSASARRPQAA
jgi:ribose transport system ATP-binding protein